MSERNTSEDYLGDLGKELVILARKAQQESRTKDPFQIGRQMAFYEVLSLMKQQAKAFGLKEDVVGLQGIDIEALLT
jgi:hypothetical protein